MICTAITPDAVFTVSTYDDTSSSTVLGLCADSHTKIDMTQWLWIGYEQIVDKDHRPPPVTSAKDPHEGAQAASSPQTGELAAELRRIRLAAGLSRVQIAQEVGLPEPDLSRLETGQVTPSASEVARWSYAVGASDRVRKQLLSLAAAASEVIALPHWLQTDVVALQDEASRLEASSPSQRTCLVKPLARALMHE